MGSTSRDESTSDGDNSSGDASESKSKSLFSEGEKVLAYHGPRIYEAKVQKAEMRKNEWRYFVHYLGWNKKAIIGRGMTEFNKLNLVKVMDKELLHDLLYPECWDEWVGMDRLMKYTEENVLKQQALDKKAGVDKSTKSGRSSQTKPKSSFEAKVDKEEMKNTVAKGKKRKTESSVEDNPADEKLIKLQIPASLKKQLLDDWELITQQNKLVKLPRSPSVDDILTKYLEYRSKKDGMITDTLGEILNGLRSYFDKALPVILLYKKERTQYRETISEDVSPSSVYGAEHFLRLFVKLPELLAFVKIEEETLIRLQQRLVELLKYLQKNESTFFRGAYEGSKAAEGSGKGKDN